MLRPAFHFHSVILIFVNMWLISTLCVADMVHAVADMVCGRYRRFPVTLITPDRVLILMHRLIAHRTTTSHD